MTDTAHTAPDETPAGTASGRPEGADSTTAGQSPRPKEIGGRKGPEPTRYGDWEKNGRCIDF